MDRKTQRKINEKYQRKHPASLKEIRIRNKQPRFFKQKIKVKPPVLPNFKKLYCKIHNVSHYDIVFSRINEKKLALKEIGFITKKTKNNHKLKKLQRALRARVLQLSYKELIPAKDAKGKTCFLFVTGAEKTQAGILRSKIIEFMKEINPIYNKSNSKSLRIYKRNEQRKKQKLKNKSK